MMVCDDVYRYCSGEERERGERGGVMVCDDVCRWCSGGEGQVCGDTGGYPH